MNHSFQNKIAWITGASSGIGEGLAIACARAGAKLVLSARREAELNRVKQSAGLTDENCLVLPMDMEKMDEFPAKLDAVLKKFGTIDYLFHNAGISQRSLVKDTPLSIDQKVLNINFFSVVALTKLVLPVFLEKKSGHFIITSSLVGKFGTPMRSAYSASKHALHGFFESLRAESWRDGIQVTIVCPGYVKTNISLNAVNEQGSNYGKMDENQAKGMDPVDCAHRILSAVQKGKREVLIGGKETLGVYLKRFFPALLWRVVRNYNFKTVENQP
jgi:short-subunit dehydrogenase